MSIFGRIGVSVDGQFKHYAFTFMVPLALVFSPARLQALSQITSAVELASAINGWVLAPSVEELISQRLVFRKLVSWGLGYTNPWQSPPPFSPSRTGISS